MREAEQVSLLIGDIYDAALDPALWPPVLGKLADFVGGQTAGLIAKDSVSKHGNVHYQVGVDDHYMQLYQDTYWRFDPLAPLLFSEVGHVTSSIDFLPEEEFRAGRFYREWVEPQGWIDAANVVLEKSATSFSLLSVIRSKAAGVVDDEMRWRMGLVIPHLQRSVLVGKVIDLKTAQAATFADTLDGISAAMFLVGADGGVVHANTAGERMLANRGVLRLGAGKLVALDAGADKTLKEIVLSAGSGDEAIGVRGIALPLNAENGDRYVAHVLPLTSGERRRAGVGLSAVAAVFVRKATIDTPGPAEIIAQTYKLTPTELRVLLAVVEVGGAPEVAEALGVAEETIKSHLKRLFQKTDTRRQADLVKIVAGYANMPAG